ncbi:MAG: alpha/beta hydrolase, partial [Tardiphaga sp.]
MFDQIDNRRRRLLGAAATTMAMASFGIAGGAHAEVQQKARGGTSAPGTAFGPLRQVDAGVLNVGYADVGPADGP